MFVQVFIGVLLYTLDPLSDLGVFEFLKRFQKRSVKLLDIFVLFAVVKRAVQVLESFHRFLNTVF